MIRILLFFALLLGAAYGFASVADLPGHVIIAIGATEYRVSLITGLIGLIALIVTVMLVWAVLRTVLRLPTLVGLANRMRRQAKGQQAVARGLVAVGVGDRRMAERYANDAQKLLGKEPLALLLKAQSAQLSGDATGAEATFKSMLDAPETEGLGLRGLFIEAQRQGDSMAARLFAEEAYKRTPQAIWASEALLGFRAASGDWRGAIEIVEQNVSRRVIDREAGRAQRAVLLTAEALAVQASSPDDAFTLAQDALRVAPGLVPAAEIAGRRATAKGDYGKAARILEAAWKITPHPDIADAYLNARPGDSALDRLKRARTLAKLQPNARDSRFAVARAAIDAREFGVAREALEALVLQKATAHACLLMAELEEVESGNQGLVRSWLARASRAPRDPAWVADGHVSETWQPVSPVTGRIGAFVWTDPPQANERHLRARIDADRFEQLPPVTVAGDVSAATNPALPTVIDAEPLAASGTVALPPVSEASVEPDSPARNDAMAEAERVVRGASAESAGKPFIPDDPGPEPNSEPPRKRFSLFGS